MQTIRTWAAAALFLAACAAQATPVASDNLNSATLGSLAGQNTGSGWASGWTGSNNVKVVNALAADGAITGDALAFSGADNASAATRVLGSTISASHVLIDFNLQFDAGQIDGNDFLALWFGDSTGPNIGVKGNCDGAAGCNGADLFVRTKGTSGSFSTAMTVGTTYHLYALLEKTGNSSVYNSFSLWVDPTADEMKNFSGADAVFTGASSISSFSTIGFRNANLDSNDVVLVDNLNISTVPEPSGIALAGIALLGLVATSRRRAAR
ncbi:PEP-CTERM sorting domain-containing protein [Burkholderiaceae bacterium UC74_6]